jgi:fumarate reductase subunit D
MFIGWIFFCVAAAMFASIRRERSTIGWFFVAFFFSPLVAFILLAILKPAVKSPKPANDEGISDERRSGIEGVVLVVSIVLVLWMGWAAMAHADQQQVFRDASGRTIGTATRNGNQTTFRDASGRTTGTVTTPSRR